MRGVLSTSSYRVLVVALVAAIPSSLRAQSGAAPQGSGVAPRLAANVEIVVNRLVDSARSRGLPAEPLLSKAAEGALKGADSTRIVNAVRRLVDELEVARTTLGPISPSAELIAAASALHAGVTPSQLAHVAQLGGGAGGSSAKSDRLVMPLVVLADLVARRVSANVAVSSLESLLSRAAPDAEFASLRAAIERDIANGTSPDAAMRARSAAVARTLDAKTGVRPPEE
jgi:hypothetical protein